MKMPVSATHAIVGAVVGMTITGVGFGCLDWSFTGNAALFSILYIYSF